MEFIEYHLENKEEELKNKWKIIKFLIEENKEILEKDGYYSISRLKEILKKRKNEAVR